MPPRSRFLFILLQIRVFNLMPLTDETIYPVKEYYRTINNSIANVLLKLSPSRQRNRQKRDDMYCNI